MGRLSGTWLRCRTGFERAGPPRNTIQCALWERLAALAAQRTYAGLYPTTRPVFSLSAPAGRPSLAQAAGVDDSKKSAPSSKAFPLWRSARKGAFAESFRNTLLKAREVRRIRLCTGKIYYDLKTSRRNPSEDMAILRLEQLLSIGPRRHFVPH